MKWRWWPRRHKRPSHPAHNDEPARARAEAAWNEALAEIGERDQRTREQPRALRGED